MACVEVKDAVETTTWKLAHHRLFEISCIHLCRRCLKHSVQLLHVYNVYRLSSVIEWVTCTACYLPSQLKWVPYMHCLITGLSSTCGCTHAIMLSWELRKWPMLTLLLILMLMGATHATVAHIFRACDMLSCTSFFLYKLPALNRTQLSLAQESCIRATKIATFDWSAVFFGWCCLSYFRSCLLCNLHEETCKNLHQIFNARNDSVWSCHCGATVVRVHHFVRFINTA